VPTRRSPRLLMPQMSSSGRKSKIAIAAICGARDKAGRRLRKDRGLARGGGEIPEHCSGDQKGRHVADKVPRLMTVGERLCRHDVPACTTLDQSAKEIRLRCSEGLRAAATR
jgi:hypothetical protein